MGTKRTPKQVHTQAELPDAPEAADPGGREADEGVQTVGTNNEERLAMMARINDQVDVDRQDELAHVNDDDSTEPFSVEGQPTATGGAPAEGEAAAPAEGEPAEPAAATEPEPTQLPLKFKIKVNGKDVELTQEELIARAQKVEAADAYLAEAARMRKEQQDAMAPKQKQPPIKDAAAEEEEERALVRAIQMGTEEEAMAALRKLKNNGPSVTADDVARTVDERLTFKDAANRFSSEYQDIMADAVLKKMALQRDQELLNDGDKRGYWERFQSIGDELRTWRDDLVKANTPALAVPAVPANPQADKQQRKAAAPQVPQAANKKAPSSAAEDEKEESVSEVIASIAKARGGPQWART